MPNFRPTKENKKNIHQWYLSNIEPCPVVQVAVVVVAVAVEVLKRKKEQVAMVLEQNLYHPNPNLFLLNPP